MTDFALPVPKKAHRRKPAAASERPIEWISAADAPRNVVLIVARRGHRVAENAMAPPQVGVAALVGPASVEEAPTLPWQDFRTGGPLGFEPEYVMVLKNLPPGQAPDDFTPPPAFKA